MKFDDPSSFWLLLNLSQSARSGPKKVHHVIEQIRKNPMQLSKQTYHFDGAFKSTVNKWEFTNSPKPISYFENPKQSACPPLVQPFTKTSPGILFFVAVFHRDQLSSLNEPSFSSEAEASKSSQLGYCFWMKPRNVTVWASLSSLRCHLNRYS